MGSSRRWLGFLCTLALISSLIVPAGGVRADGGTPVTRQLVSGGTTTLRATTEGTDTVQKPELPPGVDSDEAPAVVNRSLARGHGARPARPLPVPTVAASAVAGTNPGLGVSFDGLNFRQQRLANGGNQFSVEPPDQGLCVGNGFVLESINDVLRVFSTAGTPASGVVDLNTFYGYTPAINRSTGVSGPFVTDPSCSFDADTQRWFNVVLTLDTLPATGAFTGKNHLDLAVSATASPLGSWTIYRLPVQDDGTDGTPNHHCSQGPCIGDYPHIGADKYGFFVTTNEYSFFGPEFKSAQIYAIAKAALAAGAASPAVVQFENTSVAGTPGFTIWPAVSPAGQDASEQNGSEYFLSSLAAEEAGNATGIDNRLGIWAVTNTQSLTSGTPALALQSRFVAVETYGVPPKSEQKAGTFPLGQCVNDTTLATPFGPGCWQLFFTSEPAHTEVISHLDSNDSRMQQVVYAAGQLWGSLDTVVNVGGAEKAGIAWFAIKPVVTGNGMVVGTPAKQGYLALANNNLTYPAIAVLPGGKGVMAFTLVGGDHYPSAGYAAIDLGGVGAIHVAAAGRGPADGFTSYKAFVGNPPRTRWGDYGAAVADGSSIWVASEYIGQTCTLAQYTTAPIGSCGGTRASLGNWDTRITNVTP